MSVNYPDYKAKLRSQIQEEYGKVVYTYTCHFEIVDRLQKRNNCMKWWQLILSAISTGGFLGTVIINQQFLIWISGLCSTILLILNGYLKDKDIASEIAAHKKAGNDLWKIREDYLSLLTDFEVLSESEIAMKRDAMIERCAIAYATMPATDFDSYQKAQQALKNGEEQFFTQAELNKILPQHLRKED